MTTTATIAPVVTTPITRKHLQICLDSASFWVEELPRYADRNQKKADLFALLSGIVATLTGLAVWPSLNDNPSAWAKGMVSGAAFVAAVLALVPRVKNYGENAGQARELCTRYGRLKGQLTDLVREHPPDSAMARLVIAEFDATKEKKDALRDLPDRLVVLAERASRVRATVRAEMDVITAQLEEYDAQLRLEQAHPSSSHDVS